MSIGTMEDPNRPPPGDDPSPTPPAFRHPSWMVAVVLIFGVGFLLAGLDDPVWWLIGFPCILVLAVWIWVRVLARL